MKGLCLIIGEDEFANHRLENTVSQAVEGGVTMVQYRASNATTADLTMQASRLKKILTPYNVPLMIYDRIDIALAVEAQGVHIDQKSMPFSLVKELMPAGSMIGLSVDSWAQFEQAQDLDLTYVMIKPILSDQIIPDDSWGMPLLQKAQDYSQHRIMVAGEMNKHEITKIMKMGIDEIAVARTISASADPKQTSQDLANLLGLI